MEKENVTVYVKSFSSNKKRQLFQIWLEVKIEGSGDSGFVLLFGGLGVRAPPVSGWALGQDPMPLRCSAKPGEMGGLRQDRHQAL